MSFSVGVLYSASDFLKQLQFSPIKHAEFKDSFHRFSLASAEAVLSVSQQCGWIAISIDGTVEVTERGINIVNCADYVLQLRRQLLDMISIYQPIWSMKIPSGRAEAKSSLPGDVRQCFSEAGLFDDWTDDLIHWWDSIAQAAKAKKSIDLLAIGRDAERRSVEYEILRTGIRPAWQSLESNYLGYDVLSRVSNADETPLKIEVKGSTLGIKQSYFTFTRNEWKTAESASNYCLHLWSLTANPVSVIVVDRDELAPHLPHNKGNGEWETTRIPFNTFKS